MHPIPSALSTALITATLGAALATVGTLDIPDAAAAPCGRPPSTHDYSWKSAHLFEEKFRFYQLTPRNRVRANLIATLNEIGREYHHVAPPPFLKLFFFPGGLDRPNTIDYVARAYYQRLTNVDLGDEVCPEAIAANCGWAMGINPAHNRYDMRRFVPPPAGNLKCEPEGLTMIGYFSHPAVTVDTTNEQWAALRENPGYLVTILDLRAAHLPFLQEIKRRGTTYLEEKFAVSADDGDRTLMYFHWPTGFKTSTLHMHLKANYIMSTPEYLRSYTIDEVIAAVQSPDGVAGMIADRILHVGGLVLPEESENVEILLAAHIGPKVTIPNPFAEIPKIFKWVLEANARGAFFQLTHPDEGRDNSIRLGGLEYLTMFAPAMTFRDQGGGDTRFLSDAELGRLNMTTFQGPMLDFFACLFPFFNGRSNELCIQVTNRDAMNANPAVLPTFTLGAVQEGRLGR